MFGLGKDIVTFFQNILKTEEEKLYRILKLKRLELNISQENIPIAN